jgi:hypothetical protein
MMTEDSTMTRPVASRTDWRTGVLALISPARPQLAQRRNLYLATVALRIVGAGLLVWIGYIHYHLWQEGYKFIPTNGPLFLVDAIAAVVLAAVMLVWARPLTGLLAAGFVMGTILALVISLTVGLFGFNESIHASFVVESLILEGITAIILAIWTVIAASAIPRRP